MTAFPYLSWITFVPLIGALVVVCFGGKNDRAIKTVSLLASLVSLVMALVVWYWFDPRGGLMFEERLSWIPALNVDYRLGSTRVLTNQRGYPDERAEGFEPGLVVEV